MVKDLPIVISNCERRHVDPMRISIELTELKWKILNVVLSAYSEYLSYLMTCRQANSPLSGLKSRTRVTEVVVY